jgi:hypothetical protein
MSEVCRNRIMGYVLIVEYNTLPWLARSSNMLYYLLITYRYVNHDGFTFYSANSLSALASSQDIVMLTLNAEAE